MSGEIVGAVVAGVVHQEHHLAASCAERGPAVGEDRVLECRMCATNLVRRQQLLLRKDGTDLGIERVELGGTDRVRLHEPDLERIGNRLVLQLDEDRDRKVPGMCVRPSLHLLEALHEGQARALEVDLLDVEHLEARLFQLGDPGIRRQAQQRQDVALVVEPAGRVGEHVELDLTDLLVVELHVEGRVRVLEAEREERIEAPQRRPQRLARLDVIRVVTADHLGLVEAEAPVGEVRARGGRARRGTVDRAPLRADLVERILRWCCGGARRQRYTSRGEYR